MDGRATTSSSRRWPRCATTNTQPSIPQGPPPEEEYSGRSSFDASSGGEYYEDVSENEMSYQDPTMGMNNMNAMNNMGMNPQMNMGQAQGGAQYGVYGNQAGDYLSDFEGR
jgi:transcription factor CRZ1